MATRKTRIETGTEESRAASYELALAKYASAVDTLRSGDISAAHKQFTAIDKEYAEDEPELVERSRMYIRVCNQRSTPEPTEPTDADGHYQRAVVLANQGKFDEAVALTNRIQGLKTLANNEGAQKYLKDVLAKIEVARKAAADDNKEDGDKEAGAAPAPEAPTTGEK